MRASNIAINLSSLAGRAPATSSQRANRGDERPSAERVTWREPALTSSLFPVTSVSQSTSLLPILNNVTCAVRCGRRHAWRNPLTAFQISSPPRSPRHRRFQGTKRSARWMSRTAGFNAFTVNLSGLVFHLLSKPCVHLESKSGARSEHAEGNIRFWSCDKAVVNVFPHKVEPFCATRTRQYLLD